MFSNEVGHLNTLSKLEKISDYVFLHAKDSPRTEALVWKDVRINYEEFSQQVENITRALLASGVKHGDRIGFLGSPRPEFFVVMMATVDIGAVWMGLHPRYQMPEFRHVVELASPKIIFAFDEIEGRHYGEELTSLKTEFSDLEEVVRFECNNTEGRSFAGVPFESFLKSGCRCSDIQLQEARDKVVADDPAVIIFTSGTTGKPKGAMNSHYGLVYCAQIELSRWPDPQMRVLQNMPINHIANIGMMSSCALVAGGTLVFQDRFDPGELLQLIEKEKITFWLQSPVQFHMVSAHENFSTTDLSSLKYIIWGGGPMPQHLVEKLYQLDVNLATAYGMTELTAYVTYSDLGTPPEILANTIGRPEPRYDLRLMSESGTIANVGQSGEIQAKGRWIMKGYFNQPEATRETFTDDGWFKTGDVAELCEDGNWRLVGRLKEMYKSGGYNIYPREIEIAIEEHPNVGLTAVLGISDDLYDEVGYAFVERVKGMELSEQELIDWCRQRLANYKVPKRFIVVEELPRLPIGKIDKQILKKQFETIP